MMVLGIPEYRLPRPDHTRDRRDPRARHRGPYRVPRRGGQPLDALFDQHAALFLAIGTGRARDLDLPGHELDGVLRAVEYLLNVNQGFQVDLGERVVVVGGGNVAFDAARTALRAAAGGGAAPEPVALGAAARTTTRAER